MQFCSEQLFKDRDPSAHLDYYLHEVNGELRCNTRPAMIVFPGGGYWGCSFREAEPIALMYMNEGFNVFVLFYSVGDKAVEYRPIIEAALTVKYVRENAERFHINPDEVFVCGFSAGGHLACTTGTLWNSAPVKAALGDAPEGISRPDGMVLSYPVITGTKWAHKGSIDALLGDPSAPDSEREQFSLEKFVTKQTPPTFLWHTCPDSCVPVMNSLLFAEQLAIHHVPFEMHIYPDGEHGLATCNPETCDRHFIAESWMKDSARWIKDVIKNKKE